MNTRTQPCCGTQIPSGAPERLINGEAERLMIGNILATPGFFRRVGPQLDQECFAIEQYRRVFELAQQIHESGGDPVVSECLRAILATGKTADEMGLPSLTSLAWDNQVELVNPDRWIRDLKHKAAERRLWRAAERLRSGVESGINAAGELAAARDELRAIEGVFDAPVVAGATIADAIASVGIDNLLAAPRGTISPWRTLACWHAHWRREEHSLPTVSAQGSGRRPSRSFREPGDAAR